MSQDGYQNFTIAHQLKRRLRIIVPALRKDHERAHILAILLYKRDGIEQVRAVPDIASVTIEFEPERLPADNLLRLLDSVLPNIGQKPRAGLRALQRKHKHPDQPLRDFVFGIGGMSCTSCALYLEMLLKRQPEVVSASVNYLSETARVKSWLNQDELFALIDANGYRALAIDSLSERKQMLELEHKRLQADARRLKTLSMLSVPIGLLGLFGLRSRKLLWLQFLLSTPLIFVGGRDIFRKTIAQAKQGAANMDSLIALGVGAAYAYSLPALFLPARHVYFGTATAIIDFVLIGRYLEVRAKNTMIGNIRKLVDLQPQTATVLRENQEVTLNTELIAAGDIVLVRPGEKIPADGIVMKGLSTVDETRVTGSSALSVKEKGHQVYEGSLNGSGVLLVRATAAGKDSVLANLIHMVDQSQTAKLQIQTTVDRFCALFVPGVILLSAGTFGGWLYAGERAAHALSNAIAVLLISCPCALGLATPSATMVGNNRAAQRGIYIRNGEALEFAAGIDTVVFDKTGTITEGNAEITDLLNISSLDDERLLQLAASAERNSEHFLARAIIRHTRALHVELLESSGFFSQADQGIRADVADHKILLGTPAWLEQHGVDCQLMQASARRLSAQGKILVYLAIDRQLAGLMALTDPIRAEAVQAIRALHAQHIDTLMVTGDNEIVAHLVAGQIGIDRIHAAAGPSEKLRLVRELQQQGHRVAMVGDGMNDAPALAAADLSLAIDKGTDIAIESSDLILLNGDISRVSDAIVLSRETLANIRQNLFWAFGYNAIAVPFAVAGKLTPTLASAAMALSSVSIIFNSLRLNKS